MSEEKGLKFVAENDLGVAEAVKTHNGGVKTSPVGSNIELLSEEFVWGGEHRKESSKVTVPHDKFLMSIDSYVNAVDMEENYAIVAHDSEISGIFPLTVEFWAKNTETALNGRRYVMKHSTGASSEWIIDIDADNRIRFSITNTDLQSETLLASGVRKKGDWQHIAATYDGANMKIFVDGDEVASKAFSGETNYHEVDMAIGANLNGGSREAIDSMVRLRIWNKVFENDGVKELMTSYDLSNEPDIVAQWLMDEGDGDTLSDTVSNNHATTNNTAEWLEEYLPIFSDLKGMFEFEVSEGKWATWKDGYGLPVELEAKIGSNAYGPYLGISKFLGGRVVLENEEKISGFNTRLNLRGV